jgi:ATP-dependent Clp protease, protease subunit
MTDLNTYLLRSRVVFVGSRITDEVKMKREEFRFLLLSRFLSFFPRPHFSPFFFLSKKNSYSKHTPSQTALRVVAALLSMEILDDEKDITMYINSAGGSPYSAVGIVDTMRTLRPKIRTVAFGQAATTASLLLAAGAKGQRYAMPSARIMLHQPIGGAAGSADEVNITATELHRTSRLINCFLAEYTDKTEEEIEIESDRPSWMSPAQALEFGIIDHVLPPSGGGVVLDSRAMAAAAAAAATVEFEQMKLAKEDGSKEGDIDV